MLDCGGPVVRLLGQMGRDTGEIGSVLISHLHGDHVFALPTLVAARAMAHPELPPLRVVGPEGLAARLTELGHLNVGEHFWGYVTEHQGPLVEEWTDGQSGELDGFRLAAVRVEHYPQLECLGFRLEAGGVSLGYSGDSTLCPGVRQLAGSVQYLLCECSSMTAPAPGHLWREEVEQLMREAPGARFILTHLFDRAPVPGALLASDGLVLRLRPPLPD